MRKPEWLREEHLEFLEELRKEGMNPYFTTRPLREKFPELNERQSTKVVLWWLDQPLSLNKV